MYSGHIDPLAIRVWIPTSPPSSNDNPVRGVIGEVRENYTRLPEKNGEFIIPFAPGLKSLEFWDASGKPFGSVQVGRQISNFCQSVNSRDPNSDGECANWLAESAGFVSPSMVTR